MSSNRFFGSALAAAIVAIPVLVQGCSEADNPLCCTEFKAGGEIDVNISGNAQAQVTAQAVADLSGLADGAVDGLTTACRNIATDLAAAPAERDAAAALTGTAAMKAWCDLAVKSIRASGTVTIELTAGRCEASVSAKANCQAKCDVSGKCDIKANPPRCTGGKLQVSCEGSCEGSASAEVQCSGSCSAECKGSCTAQGGVQCSGRCEGTCKGQAQGGTGEGIKADGTCDGTCEGTCEVTAPGVTCSGTCQGGCTGSCTASAGAKIKCDGECKGTAEPISCEGGKLEGGCQVDAKCDASCDASVKAKVECTPPGVKVNASASAIIPSLEANLPLVFQIKGRLEGAAQIAGSVDVSAAADIKPACIPVLVASAANAVSQLGETVTVSAQVAGSVGQ